MMIIDPHVHIGHDTTWDSNRTEEELWMKMNEVGIQAFIVQPAQYVTFEEYRCGHDTIYNFHSKHPKRIFGMFSMNPHFNKQMYQEEAERCVKKLGFVALKLTPLTHIMSASVMRARLPFETARQLGVPLMIHQGTGLPFSSAITYYNLIREFSDVSIVLAHSGTYDNEDEDIFLAKNCPNVYLELSVRTPNIGNIIRFGQAVGTDRMMFASDSPDEMEHVIWECRHCGFNQKQTEQVLGETAMKVFSLEERL